MSESSVFANQTDPRQPVKEKAEKQNPDSKTVEKFHTNSDVDSSQKAQHHTLGSSRNQASPGDHTHDGGTSNKSIQPLLGTTLTGSKGGNAALASVVAALVKLGATDSTT